MTECESKNECSQMAKEYAEQAAEKAVKKTFAILGVDVDDPNALEEFREDLRFGKRMRRAADKGFMTAVTVLTGALMLALWVGILIKIGEWIKTP
jgi:peroxiredoxin